MVVPAAATRSEVTQLDATLAALADPHRRGVVDLLRHQPRRAGDLADQLGMSRPAMSRHLKVLRRTGLIEPASDDADARARIYRLSRSRSARCGGGSRTSSSSGTTSSRRSGCTPSGRAAPRAAAGSREPRPVAGRFAAAGARDDGRRARQRSGHRLRRGVAGRCVRGVHRGDRSVVGARTAVSHRRPLARCDAPRDPARWPDLEAYGEGQLHEVGAVVAWQPPRYFAFTWRSITFTRGEIDARRRPVRRARHRDRGDARAQRLDRGPRRPSGSPRQGRQRDSCARSVSGGARCSRVFASTLLTPAKHRRNDHHRDERERHGRLGNAPAPAPPPGGRRARVWHRRWPRRQLSHRARRLGVRGDPAGVVDDDDRRACRGAALERGGDGAGVAVGLRGDGEALVGRRARRG